jgi:hypothetical protein
MNDAVQKRTRINWMNLSTIVSAAILIGVEVIGIGLATGWALAALFGFSKTIEAILISSSTSKTAPVSSCATTTMPSQRRCRTPACSTR